MIQCCFSWHELLILLFVCIQKDFVIQEALEEHDKDGDGFVSLEEFLGDYRRDPSKEKREGAWKRELTKAFGMGRVGCTFIFSFSHLHLQILSKIFCLGIILFSKTGHSSLLISVCPIWWWSVCSPFHSFLASCFLFSEILTWIPDHKGCSCICQLNTSAGAASRSVRVHCPGLDQPEQQLPALLWKDWAECVVRGMEGKCEESLHCSRYQKPDYCLHSLICLVFFPVLPFLKLDLFLL